MHRSVLILFGVLGAVIVAARLPYPEAAPLAHTGGFGEPTCYRCHFDNPLNAPGGTFTLGGVPKTYVAGQRYVLNVELARTGMGRGGFQLAARFPDGRQAGMLEAISGRVAVATIDSTGVQYAGHTEAGTRLVQRDTARWAVAWTAPDSGSVQFHLVGNAANDDASEFGDFVYQAEHLSGR